MKEIDISPELLKSTGLSEQEFRQEIAVMLYSMDKLTLGQASKLADMTQIQFQHVLASRQIPLHYGIEDLEADMATLRELGRL